MKKVRWGLLSTAKINQLLIPAIRDSKRAELAAVASRNLETAKQYAQENKIPKAFGGYQEMLDSGAIDAVYISLPNHLHAEWSIKALQSGVHVLCEKPFAISLEEVDQMIAASQESACFIAEAFMYRHHPQTKLTTDWVASGRLGEVFLIRGEFNFLLKNRDNVRLLDVGGGGCLWDIGVYPISFAQYIYQNVPEFVFGTQWLGPSEVDEVFIGQMRYPGNRLAQIAASFRSPFHTQMEILGTKGRLLLTRPFSVLDSQRRMTFFGEDEKALEIPVPKMDLYSGEVEDLNSAILENSSPLITLQETRNHIRTVLALYDSAKSQLPMELI